MFVPTLTRSRLAALLTITIAVAVGGACGSDDSASSGSDPGPPTAPSIDTTSPSTDMTAPAGDTTTPGSTEPVTTPTSIATGVGDLGPTARRLVDVAVADLVERFDLADSASEVVVVTVEEVTWRDSSIGCPMRDMQYLQVLTPGTLIVLEHDGQQYSYHAGGGREPFYCATPQTPVADG
jgi:hypothetical protein